MDTYIRKCDPHVRHVVRGPLGEYHLYREGKAWSCKYKGAFPFDYGSGLGLKDLCCYMRKDDTIRACKSRLCDYALIGQLEMFT